MIKIIKEGSKRFTAVCVVCDCEFSYSIDDLDLATRTTVNCPCCQEPFHHFNRQRASIVGNNYLNCGDSNITIVKDSDR